MGEAVSDARHVIAGAQVTADLENVTESGGEVVGDVLTVTSVAPLTAAWQAVAGGSFLPLAGGTMTGNIVMSAGADVILGAGSNQILDTGTYLEFGGDTYIQRYGAALLNFPGTGLRVEGFQPAQFSENAAINCVAGGVHATPGSLGSAAFAAGQAGDTNPRAVIRASGAIEFGSGAAGVDTYLTRTGAALLNTPGSFDVGQTVTADKFVGTTVGRVFHASGGGYAEFDSAGAGVQFLVARAAGDAQNRWQFLNNGEMRIGDGVFVPDVRFRRPAATPYAWHMYQGALSHAEYARNVNVAGTVVLNEWDDVIFMDSNTPGLLIQLPGGTPAGKKVTVKDVGGIASVNNMVIDPNGPLIDGVAGPYLFTVDYGAITLQWDGVDWWIVGSYP